MTNQHPDHIGKYVVEEYLGGGMSHVYRAKEPLLGKTVAVKILKADRSSDPESRSRFLREAQLAANISHDHILSVYDFGEHEGQPFMVMEFLRGQDLRTCMQANRFPELSAKLRIALQIAEALQYIHGKKIIHRDIKPENVHINESGVAKLIDFGIAKAEDVTMITRAGFTIGTPSYMAPEQVLGKEVTNLADIYAYGILLFELFTGTRPITGDSVEQIFFRILQVPIDSAPLRQAGVPESIIALISACTAKDPAVRPQDISTVCAQLKQELDATTGSVKKEELKPPRSSTKTSIAAAAIVCLLLLVAAIGLFLYRPNGPRQATTGAVSESAAATPVSDSVPPPVIKTPAGEMVFIPGGEFLSGADRKSDKLPGFYIGRTEVTNEAYGRFCEQTGHPLPPGFNKASPDYPVVNITVTDAKDFAAWADMRLPRLKEWEKAARGTDGREYPWGNDRNSLLANVASDEHTPGKVAPVTAFSAVETPWEIHQMIGNVWEFVDELGTPSPNAIRNFRTLVTPPPTKDELWYSIMGGSYEHELLPRATYDAALVPARFRSEDIGFRCVQDLAQRR